MTPEQQAVRQHLSKPRPYSSGCGCLGPQLKSTVDHSAYRKLLLDQGEYYVRVVEFSQPSVAVMAAVRVANPALSIADVANARKEGEIKLTFHAKSYAEDAKHMIESAGGKAILISNEPAREPYCPCRMSWVEVVDNHYYDIKENRSPDGITVTARLIGPVDGPYVLEE